MALKYDKKTQREHVLIRPDTYIGDIEPNKDNMWVVKSKGIAKKGIKYVPGLYKIFDEIAVNARDHHVNDSTCNSIDIVVEEDYFSISNNGNNGIPVVEHPKHKSLIPTMIFGEMLTSSNYDDNEKRTTGGRNGLGSKCANIFSTKFEVQVIDNKNKKEFNQSWEENMSIANKPSVKKCTKKGSCKVTCYPDFKRFKIKNLKNHIPLFHKRAYDIALTTSSKVKVTFNGEQINIKNLQEYMELYYPKTDKFMDLTNDRVKVGCIYIPDNGHEVISFVNGISTFRGGTHCNYIVDMVIKSLIADIKKKNKDIKVSPSLVKENLVFFIDAIVDNPSFISQTKEALTTKSDKFGFTYTLNKAFMNKLAKSGIVQQIVSLAKFKESSSLKKTDGKKVSNIKGIPKLEDANKAGTKDSQKCALYLTEGDSAKSMVLSGLSNKDRDFYGVFPLKGKLLNVREASTKQIGNNEEINNIKKILGLKNEYQYEDDSEFKTLRYGKVIVLTDQDSVTGDTPLLVKNIKENKIEVKTIDQIGQPELYIKNIYDKEIQDIDNYNIWSDNGWTKIKKVIRHKVTKDIYRVLTHTGCVDVTEDHSLININNKEISPKDCNINDELLHSFPVFTNKYDYLTKKDLLNYNIKELWELCKYYKIRYYQSYHKDELIELLLININKPKINCDDKKTTISKKEAYLMGLFFAEGCCDIYTWSYYKKPKNRPNTYKFTRTNYTWAISNNNKELLEKMKTYCEELYPEHNFTIFLSNKKALQTTNSQPNYKLNLNGGKKTEAFIKRYRNMFYNSHRMKKIDQEILNAPNDIIEQFFEGYYEGDGFKARYLDKKAHMGFDFYGKEGAMGLYYISKKLGYVVSVNNNMKKPEVYTLTLTKGTLQKNPNIIKKITKLNNKTQYVYDLETENHHFQSGIGEMIVHNTDGSHIKGLVINFFHHFWPKLLERDDFITTMNTPIIKATKGKDVICFYNLSDYNEWKDNTNTKGYFIKYYKGLGTSDNKEAKEYFVDINGSLIDYISDDVKECNESIQLAFAKELVNRRKTWLINYNKNDVLDYNSRQVFIKDFIHKDLKHFSNADNMRSIPSLVDGFKPSQRKILYGAYLRGLDKIEIKVAQLAGFVSDRAAYHHGEASLMGAIIGMAQNFVGSNNINTLVPKGQFGDRYGGGKNHASPRYIFTSVEKITNLIFRKEDNAILDYVDDDGMKVEPEYYLPIIPMVLVNGAVGIGTGFSTNIPNYNPIDLIGYLKDKINNNKTGKLKPYYHKFKGTIKKLDKSSYQVKGCYTIDKKTNTVHITELPVGEWTLNYKQYLEKMDDTDQNFVSYTNNSTDTDIDIKVKFKKLPTKLDDKLKMIKKINLTNLHAYTKLGNIQKYNKIEDIIDEYYIVRLEGYVSRKEYLLKIYKHMFELIAYKVKFIKEIINKTLKINNKKKSDIEDKLVEKQYPKFGKDFNDTNVSYDYLLGMNLYSLTREKIEELEKQLLEKKELYSNLKKKTPEQLWLDELDELQDFLVKIKY